MFILEPYQENLVQTVAHKLATSCRSVLSQLATGGGKTVVFCAITHRYVLNTKAANQAKRVLILVHREELLHQTCRTLKNGFGINAVAIKAGARYIPPSDVYVAMVETVNKRIALLDNIGLVIIDECHLGNFTKMFAHFPTQHIIGFSATPKAASKKHPLKNYYQDIVCGIDIPELIALNKTNNERGLVQNVTYAPKTHVDRGDLKVDQTGDFDTNMMAVSFSKPQNILNTVSMYEKYAKGRKTLVFNCNIEHSLKTMQAFRDAGYQAKHIDGEMDMATRAAVLKWFKETPDAILCNVGVLTTGFDEPTVECVIVNRSTTSLPLWLQMCGRGARPLPWKNMFIIIDMGDNAQGGKLGDWSHPNDWKHIFWNPEQETKPGTAPVKDCPACGALVPAQSKICQYCGHVWPAKPAPPEMQIEDFVIITKGIDVAALIESSRTKRQYYPFFQIGDEIARNAYATITEMTDQIAEFTLSEYYRKATEWALREGKKFDDWHKNRARNHLISKLQPLFPNWKPQNLN